MNRKRVTSSAAFLLISALPLAGVAVAQQLHPANSPEPPATQQMQDNNQTQVRMFAGKISRSGGKYVLEDPASKVSFSLDDQKTAKRFEGKSVVVTGSLDAASNTIHVQKIEAAA